MDSAQYEINLLSKLVEIDTNVLTKEGYEQCASLLVEEAERLSLDTQILNGRKASEDGVSRPNVIATLDSGSDRTLLLASHFDVVPAGKDWIYPPFKLTVENGKAYGRGASDNKGGIAAAFGALRELVEEELDINVKLILSVDEEVGGKYGMEYLLEECGLRGDAALIVDSGPERLYIGASGLIWGKIVVRGKSGHAGYPFKSRNAIDESMRFIKKLKEYQRIVEEKESELAAPPNSPRNKVWGRFTLTMIHAGEKENVIPGICELRFDMRLIPEESISIAEKSLEVFFSKARIETKIDSSLEIIKRVPGYFTKTNNIFVETVSDSMNRILGEKPQIAGELGGNDGSFFAKRGIPVVCYGPIRSDTSFHGANEFVFLEDLKNLRNMIIDLGRSKRSKIS